MFPTPLPQELLKHLPNQRKLSDKTKAKASSWLQMNANKMIQTVVSGDRKGDLTDLTNIATAAKQGHS